MKLVARGDITAAILCIRLRMLTAGKSEYARVLGPYHSPNRVHAKMWPVGRQCTLCPSAICEIQIL